MSHTPGPWSVPHFAREDVACDCKYVLSESHAGAIATVHYQKPDDPDSGDPPLEEAKANARLIAAAPDLLSACEQTLDRLDYLTNLWSQEGITRTVADALRSAVAKAKGENNA